MQKRALLGIGFLCVTSLALIFGFLYLDEDTDSAETEREQHLQEIADMGGSFSKLGTYFAELAQQDGAVYAFSLLGDAELEPNIDVHLLGHIVGDELYKQQGLEGMKHCTPEFRNACSHTVVIGALLERGEGVFHSVHDVCQKAPGGKGAYTMCFHGFGHGVLAYNDYEVPDAVAMCERVGTDEYHDREYVECVGGVTMEMMSGVHDPEVWEEKANTYLPEGEPLHLCKSDAIPLEVKPICYTYITPQLFTASGAGRGNPDPERFDEAFAYCDTIPEEQSASRDACFGGLGKEFIVLVQDRDVRDFSSMTNEQLWTVVEWCEKAGVESGVRSCLTHAVNSLYWGGENPVDTPRRFCELVPDSGRQAHCVETLVRAVGFYAPKDGTYRQDFCESLPEAYRNECRENIL